MKNRRPRLAASRQRGVVMLFALVTLVIMMIAAVAMVRSFHSSLFTAGNIGFKRDLQNQSEWAVATALANFKTGGALATPANRSADVPGSFYSASILATDAQGIPNEFQSDSNFTTKFGAISDYTAADGVTKIRYVIDRLCSSPGNESSLSSGSCTLSNTPQPTGTGSMDLLNADRQPLCATCASAAPQAVVYRLSIRVSGPRGTQSFFQSTINVPSN